jgi:hypothetical protein
MVDERWAGGGSTDAISLSERILRHGRDQKRTRRRLVRIAVLSVAVACVVAVCGVLGGLAAREQRSEAWEAAHQPTRTAARPGDPAIPAIDWPNGLPDHGEWSEHPAVLAVREFEMVAAAARAAGDARESSDLALLAAPDLVTLLWFYADMTRGGSLSGGDVGWVVDYPGPRPFEVLSVEDGADGPVVTACTPEVVGLGEANSAEERMQNRSGLVFAWTLERVDGRLRVADISASVPCTIEDVHYGLFATPVERDAGSGGLEGQLEPAADPTAIGALSAGPVVGGHEMSSVSETHVQACGEAKAKAS